MESGSLEHVKVCALLLSRMVKEPIRLLLPASLALAWITNPLKIVPLILASRVTVLNKDNIKFYLLKIIIVITDNSINLPLYVVSATYAPALLLNRSEYM